MSVSLNKGEGVNLSKQAAGGFLRQVLVGLGWDERQTDGPEFDLDASVFILAADGNVPNQDEHWFVYYNNLQGPNGSVVHHGDNLTGAGDGDDEQITVHLDKLPANADKVAIAVTIHKAEERKQNFGMVSNAFVRVVNADDDSELARYELDEEFSTETAVVFAELRREGNEWSLHAIGQGVHDGLAGLCKLHGIVVSD